MERLFRRLAALLVLAGATLAATGPKLTGPVPSNEGETCAVCGGRVTARDCAYLVDGQRFTVMKAMESDFLADPLSYIAKFRPANLLFGSDSQTRLSGVCLVAGLYLLFGIFCAGLCAQMAITKGYAAWPWMIAGLALTAGAYMYLATRPATARAVAITGLRRAPSTRAPLPCPGCGGSNHPAARACLRCGAALEPAAPSEVEAGSGRRESL
jgi:hypothetical protein